MLPRTTAAGVEFRATREIPATLVHRSGLTAGDPARPEECMWTLTLAAQGNSCGGPPPSFPE
ncbi:hypothetical protein GCM10010470_03290 [Saccharopolyspora taberi]|uniref:Uncharacterized protein n=1 Tax=Saccharopolyspora taberi TaxID=60895 RepID=A0ABN3V1B5_9PSEU